MSETNLTKEIKKALRGYAPQMNSKMRTVRWAEEVDVIAGYVDSIRFEDYIANNQSYCSREKLSTQYIPPQPCKIPGNKYPCKECYGCVFHKHVYELGILTSCFEIKISKSDFESPNGHNFVGNRNYYVVPKELYLSIKDLVPDDIGIILYHGHGCLFKKKECTFREIDPGDLNRYLYNALKKWVDKGGVEQDG